MSYHSPSRARFIGNRQCPPPCAHVPRTCAATDDPACFPTHSHGHLLRYRGVIRHPQQTALPGLQQPERPHLPRGPGSVLPKRHLRGARVPVPTGHEVPKRRRRLPVRLMLQHAHRLLHQEHLLGYQARCAPGDTSAGRNVASLIDWAKPERLQLSAHRVLDPDPLTTHWCKVAATASRCLPCPLLPAIMQLYQSSHAPHA